ncbi:MAG: hypothetical protein HQL80_13365 [Magnetococcales bacterium]|nr:hypothetical protein [Magnetococcales bacterium]
MLSDRLFAGGIGDVFVRIEQAVGVRFHGSGESLYEWETALTEEVMHRGQGGIYTF